MVVELTKFDHLINADAGDGTKSVVLFEFGNAIVASVVLDFLPELSTSIVGGWGLVGGCFLGWGRGVRRRVVSGRG